MPPLAEIFSLPMSGRFGYTGQMRLPELGLMHYKARAYSPAEPAPAKAGGRFLQPDPIGTNGGLNVYEYAGSDPVNASDPSGLSGCGSRTSSDSASCFSVIPPSYQNGSPGGGKPDEYGDVRPTGPGHWRRNIVNGLSSGWYYVGKGSPEMLRAAAGAQAGNENGTDELSEIVVAATKPKSNNIPIVTAGLTDIVLTGCRTGSISNGQGGCIPMSQAGNPDVDFCDARVPNGCGAAGSILPIPNSFPKSCNIHDICYGTLTLPTFGGHP
jgi:RHS repeat-associated protein